MKVSDLPARLRELADRIEAAELPEGRIRLEIGSYDKHVDTRDKLRQWARFLGTGVDVLASGGNVWLSTYGDITASIFFTPGLLGGKRVETFIDDRAGLAALLAEQPAAEKAVVA